MPPAVRYARSGDLNIAYQVVGSGPTDLVWTSGASSHLELFWEEPRFARTFERLATFSRFIILDKRGTGLSDRPDHLATLEERADDIRAVMDAAGSERAHIIGISEGGSMAMLFAATYPHRIRSLILYGTMPRWSWAPDWPWGMKHEELQVLRAELAARDFRDDLTSPRWRKWFGAPVRDDPAFVEWWGRFMRSGTTPAARLALADMNMLLDARDVLPAIRVPTLVMNRADDPVAPIEAVRAWAAMIPGARLAELPGEGHLYFDVWEQWIATIEEFVTGTASPVGSDRFLATLLSADVVGSTELIARIGDEAWRSVLARHYSLVARHLAVYGGVEVDRAGDGFLARFDGPARAIRCARSVQEDDRSLGLQLRAGVHTGEVEAAGGALRGMAVHVAARIAALAAAEEVLVSSTVRDLVAGAGFTFLDRGAHQLKGIPEPRQVFAVA